MSSKKKWFHILGKVGAIVLSVLLVGLLIVAPLYSVAVSATKPEQLAQIAKDVDLMELLVSSGTLSDAIKTGKTDTALVEALVDSPMAGQAVTAYTTAVIDFLNGETETVVFSEKTLEEIALKHKGMLMDMAKKRMPKGVPVPEAVIEKEVTSAVKEISSRIVEVLPDEEALLAIAADYQRAQPSIPLFGTHTPVVLYGAIAVVAVLIFLCRLYDLKGILYLGVDALIAAVPLFVLYFLLAGDSPLSAFLHTLPIASAVVAPMLRILSGKVLISAGVLAAAGLVLVAAFIVYMIVKEKRSAKKAAAIPEAAETEVSTPEESV